MNTDLQELLKRNPISIAILVALVPMMVALGASWWLVLAVTLLSLLLFRAQPPQYFHAEQAPLPKHLAPEILSTYLDRSEHPMLFLGIGDRVAHHNKAFKSKFPMSEKDIPVANIFRNPDILRAIASVRAKGDAEVLLYESSRHPGRQYSATISRLEKPFSRIFDANLLIELRDQTEIYRMEKARRDFVANASHELRTPLAAIKGGLETIATHSDDPDALAHFLPIMQKQSDRMERMIEDLMSLSKIEGQAFVGATEVADLQAIIHDTLAVYSSKGKGASKRIKNEVKNKPSLVNGDADQLQQVLTNLIDNALKYGKDKGAVTLRLAESDPIHAEQIGLQVVDEGNGIDPKHLSRLTERFYRVNGKDKSGTGLGLAIVKKIIARHGGELRIDSAEGAGSTFTIWLKSKTSS